MFSSPREDGPVLAALASAAGVADGVMDYLSDNRRGRSDCCHCHETHTHTHRLFLLQNTSGSFLGETVGEPQLCFCQGSEFVNSWDVPPPIPIPPQCWSLISDHASASCDLWPRLLLAASTHTPMTEAPGGDLGSRDQLGGGYRLPDLRG